MVRFFNFNFNSMVCFFYSGKKEIVMKGWSKLYFHLKFFEASCLLHRS